jgi:uncharacterized protein YndB with AHSA1/START domain
MSISNHLRFAGVIAAIAVVPHVAAGDSVTLVDKPDHVTEGSVVIDAPPAEVYAAVTDYAHWQAMLHDVSDVSIRSSRGGDERDAKVHFRSRALEHEVTVQFDNVPGQVVRFRGIEGPPGGRASGSFTLAPIDGGKRTQVTASLYLDVVGVPGLFVREPRLRAMRHAKLQADMADVERRFARPPQA